MAIGQKRLAVHDNIQSPVTGTESETLLVKSRTEDVVIEAYFMANPRGSRAVSADPISPPTVLKRTM